MLIKLICMPIIVKKCAIWRVYDTIIAPVRQTNVPKMENDRNEWKIMDRKVRKIAK